MLSKLHNAVKSMVLSVLLLAFAMQFQIMFFIVIGTFGVMSCMVWLVVCLERGDFHGE